jgi:predicted dehydrogenase
MRIGVVGTGYWTQLVHGAGALASPDWDLTSVYGRSPEKAAAMAGTLSCGWTTDFDELLGNVDALVFAVPPDVQAPLALRAAHAGKHLLLEKPLALDAAGAQQLADAIAESGTANLVFFTRLWATATLGWLDGLRLAGGWESGRYEHVMTLPAGFLEGSPWRQEHGALWDVGPHALSVLERVLGPAVTVSAMQGVRDHVDLMLRHESGATSSAELCLTAPEGVTRSGFVFSGRDGEARPDEATASFLPLSACSAALSELADQVRTGRRGGVDAQYGLHVVKVLAAAQASLASGASEAV